MPDDEPPDEEDVDELLEDLRNLEQAADTPEQRKVIRQTIRTLDRFTRGRLFGLDDLAQQIVGGFVLSAPFVVTEEVWSLATGMTWTQWLITVVMVLTIGYGTLYSADDGRNPDREEAIGVVPLRFVSLIFISYLSVSILTVVLSAPETFGATTGTTVKAVSIGAIFSVVGAATADSIF